MKKLQILLPMAGAGKRFKEVGYVKPKPLIDVNGKPMIRCVIENLGIDNAFSFIVQEEAFEEYRKEFIKTLTTAKTNIILVKGLTEGAACTCLLAEKALDPSKPLMIANCDQITNFGQPGFYDWFADLDIDVDGVILTFASDSEKNSYAKVNKKGLVTEVEEKKVISKFATCGIYLWKRASFFLDSAKEMIEKDLRVNNEFYVAPTYNIHIKKGGRYIIKQINNHHSLGTPEDLKMYLKDIREERIQHEVTRLQI